MIIDDYADQEIIDRVLRPHEILEDVDRYREKINTSRSEMNIWDEVGAMFLNNIEEVPDVSQDEFMKILGAN